jgi:hypothetical protein
MVWLAAGLAWDHVATRDDAVEEVPLTPVLNVQATCDPLSLQGCAPEPVETVEECIVLGDSYTCVLTTVTPERLTTGWSRGSGTSRLRSFRGSGAFPCERATSRSAGCSERWPVASRCGVRR